MTIEVDTAIIGGGIAGLAAARALRQAGRQAIVFEAKEHPGGLLYPITEQGFTFDTAVHLSFASEQPVREVFDKVPYRTLLPESLCYDAGYWLKHPVQNNLFALPDAEKIDLLIGLAQAPSGDIYNYRDWLVQQYGEPIAARWPLPYTRKYWTVPAEELGIEWIGSRMRRADLREALAGALSATTPNHYYIKEMRYPEKGGYYAFIKSLADEADIRIEHQLTEVQPEEQRIVFANGEAITYRNIVSTMPLPELASRTSGLPASIKHDADSLYATRIDLISVGFRRPNVAPALWFYIYDPDILAARAYSPDWKSPANVPARCSALQFEIYSSPRTPQDHSAEELIRNTVDGIVKMGLATEDEIIFARHDHVPYANVVFDLGMEERRNRVRDWLRAQNIVLAGRFGEWEYLWSNQAMMSGLAAGRAVIDRP